MGLSTKQVSSDHGLDNWGQSLLQSGGGVGGLELPKPPPARRQPAQQPPERVPCPRCASANTKFCYYNNYNKSQPRHFCKACKRHWTKGGTLRNVPVGGGRKNKRHKTSNATTTTSAASATTTTTTVIPNANTQMGMGIQSQQLCQSFSQTVGDHHDKISEILYQALIPTGSFNVKSFNNNNGENGNSLLGSSSLLPLLQNHTLPPFTFSNLSSFESSNPSPISPISACFRTSEAYNFTGDLGSIEETETILPTTVGSNGGSDHHLQWQVAATSSVMDTPIDFWNWEDIELNAPWDVDNEIKP